MISTRKGEHLDTHIRDRNNEEKHRLVGRITSEKYERHNNSQFPYHFEQEPPVIWPSVS